MSKLTEQCELLKRAVIYKAVHTKDEFFDTREEGQNIYLAIGQINKRIENWERKRKGL